MSRWDLPPTHLSTMSVCSRSLVVARLVHRWERYGSSTPRTGGTLTRSTPSAVFSVPASYPLREPWATSRRSYRLRPRASVCSRAHASCTTRSVASWTKVLSTSSPLLAAVWPCRRATSSCACTSLGARLCVIRGAPSSRLVITHTHGLLYQRRASRPLLLLQEL
jgi:hypothetical protein